MLPCTTKTITCLFFNISQLSRNNSRDTVNYGKFNMTCLTDKMPSYNLFISLLINLKTKIRMTSWTAQIIDKFSFQYLLPVSIIMLLVQC